DATLPMPLAPPVMSATLPSRRPTFGTVRRGPLAVKPGRPDPPIIEAGPQGGRIRMAEQLLLGGERSHALDGKTFSVIEPATARAMAEVAEAGPEDARRAVDVAARAFEAGAWPRTSATDRGHVLLRASSLVRDRLEDP